VTAAPGEFAAGDRNGGAGLVWPHPWPDRLQSRWRSLTIGLAASPTAAAGPAPLGRSHGDLRWPSVGQLVHRSAGPAVLRRARSVA